MVAKLTLDFATSWATFLALGAFLNLICLRSYRLEIGRRVFGFAPTKIGTICNPQKFTLNQAASQFIENTLMKFYGRNPFSLKAIFRSIVVSCTFMIIIIGATLLDSGNTISMINAIIFTGNFIWVTMAIVVLFFLDWMSFVQTYFFMRVSANGGVATIIFFAYADIVLSVNIFLFIFPLFIMIVEAKNLLLPFEVTVASSIIFDHEAKSIEDTPIVIDDAARPVKQFQKDILQTLRLMRALNSQSDNDIEQTFIAGPLDGWSGRGTIFHEDDAIGYLSYWDFRYSGMTTQADVKSFVEPLLFSLFGGRTAQIIDANAALNDRPLSTEKEFAVTYTLVPELASWSPSTLLHFTYLLYGIGFELSQKIQLQMPEVLFRNSFLINPLRETELGRNFKVSKYIHSEYVGGRSFNELPLIGDNSNFILFCDNVIFRTSVILKPEKCNKSLIIFNTNSDYTTLMDARSKQSGVPVGVLFLGSFATTAIFYGSLFLFLIAYRLVALVRSIKVPGAQNFLDITSVHENSILVLVSIGGLPISIIIAWAASRN